LALITLQFTATELQILLRLATDQLFHKEFIDSRLPGCRQDIGELDIGKQLVQRMRKAAGIKEPGKPGIPLANARGR
jgi:hypothetical protein